MEIWKSCEINNEVSTLGRVRSLPKIAIKTGRYWPGVILKTRIDKYGYEIVTLSVEGKLLTRKVHRLVALAFIENPNNYETVNHKDCNKLNNTVENLEWLSKIQNREHAVLNKLFPSGKLHHNTKLTKEAVEEIKYLISEGYGNSEIGHLFGVTCGCIYSIRVGESWKN